MILVTGATGTVGSEVVRRLSALGVPFRAMTRHPEKAARLRQIAGGTRLEVVKGDMARPETLDGAVAGVDAVFLLSEAHPRQVEMQGHIVNAAKRAGVRRMVKLSVLGADETSPLAVGRWHRTTEKQIESSGFSFTHLRPHYFMQNLLAYAPAIAKRGVFHAPLGDGKISLVDVRDIAAVAARVLTEKGHEGKAYDVTGPEAISFHEAAAKLSKALGREVAYRDVPADNAERGMRMG
ncbi:MAG: SDR family oxidoreductase, partial [Elusimicrobia bacterium]|nr:SDR family oxidoreductase [Elusimicrobiota bacterium]